MVDELDSIRWQIYEVGGGDELVFSRLLDRLPGADGYETDAYPCTSDMSRAMHVTGKGGAVNRNEDWRPKLRSKLNRLVRSTKGYTKRVEMLKHLLAIALEERLKSVHTNPLVLHNENTKWLF